MNKLSVLYFLFVVSFLMAFIEIPQKKHPFIVIAHRGDHTNAPENTLQAYRNAIKIDADYIEIDLRMTKDSQLIIMHDENLKRMTGLDRKVSELTWKEISMLEIKNKEHPEWGKHRVPLFSEVLNLSRRKINIYLDFKNAPVDKTYRALLQAKMVKNVLVYINTLQQYEQWKQLAPEVPLMLSLPSGIKSDVQLKEFIEKFKPAFLDGGYESYTSDLLKIARNLGVIVWPDIQSLNEENNWGKAIDIGFDGLQTDHPKAMIDFLKLKKLR